MSARFAFCPSSRWCRCATQAPHGRMGLGQRNQGLPWRTCATSGDAEPVVSITREEAYRVLGVSGATTSFEDIVLAKNRLLEASKGNANKAMQVEAAYDVLLMESMKRRLSGELEVSSTVRYADVPTKSLRSGMRPFVPQAGMLASLPVAANPREAARHLPAPALQPAWVFGGLAAWAIVQAMLESPEAQAADTGGLQLALSTVYALYTCLEHKRLAPDRAAGVTLGSLAAGVLVGALLQQALRLDLEPIGAFGSPDVFVSDFAIAAMWAGCTLLP